MSDSKISINNPVATNKGVGYIVDIAPASTSGQMLIGVGMLKIEHDVTVIYTDGQKSVIDEHTAARIVADAKARNLQDLSDDEKAVLIERANDYEIEQVKRREAHRAKMFEENKKRKEQKEAWLKKVPSWAKSILVATYSEDDSDSMTDYHGAKNYRHVVIGFSKHNRDLFPEMRKAAAGFKPTQHLATAPESAEHREKYSMGGGYYLKDGYRYSTGWQVCKEHIDRGADYEMMTDEDRAEIETPVKSADPVSNRGGAVYHINEIFHEKRQTKIFICSPSEFMPKDKYYSELAAAKLLNGWYSRKFGSSPAGFAFKDIETAKKFCGVDGSDPVEQKIESLKAKTKPQKDGSNFRRLAEGMTNKIAQLAAPRLTNTPKRIAQANSALVDLEQHQIVQAALFTLADCLDAGTLPEELQSIGSKKDLFSLLKLETEMIPNGFHAYQKTTGKLKNPTEQTELLQLLIAAKDNAPSKADKEARDLQIQIDLLKQQNIAGFFPTEGDALNLLIDSLELKEHHKFLEPSAGTGTIAAAVKPLVSSVDCVEINSSLFDVLKFRGFDPFFGDFLKIEPVGKYDRIGMNPPFEKDQHIDHFFHAIAFLKDNTGLLCCVMPKGAHKGGHTKKRQAFNKFVTDGLESGKITIIDLPSGSFKSAGTSIESQIVKVDLWGVL